MTESIVGSLTSAVERDLAIDSLNLKLGWCCFFINSIKEKTPAAPIATMLSPTTCLFTEASFNILISMGSAYADACGPRHPIAIHADVRTFQYVSRRRSERGLMHYIYIYCIYIIYKSYFNSCICA